MSVDIIFEAVCHKITSDHSGYCSGAENEDEEEFIMYYFKVTVSQETYDIMRKLHEYNELIDIIQDNKLFDCIRNKKMVNGGRSHYCSCSESGGKHEVKFTLMKVVRVNLSPSRFNICENPSKWDITYPDETKLRELAK